MESRGLPRSTSAPAFGAGGPRSPSSESPTAGSTTPTHPQPQQQQQREEMHGQQVALYPVALPGFSGVLQPLQSLPISNLNLSSLANLAVPNPNPNANPHAPNPNPSPALQGHTHICCVPAHTGMHAPAPHLLQQPIYVLAADGSQLYLLDPSKPPRNEEPPPYLPFRPPSPPNSSNNSSNRETQNRNQDLGVVNARHRAATVTGAGMGMGLTVSPPAAVASPRSLRSPNSPHSPTWPRSPRRRDRDRADETTPLLGTVPRPSFTLRDIFLGWRGEDGREGFFAPVVDKRHWKAVVHLLVVNFPFNLFVWPPLLVGVLAGTALLITLPIGAVFWWLTLIIARWAAREERKMQAKYHDAVFSAPRPIFHHVVEVRGGPEAGDDVVVVYEKRFLRCSWAMISDHYSYVALSYFLLIKPLVVLFSTIVLVALFPVTLVLFPLFPIYMRTSRAWGWYQARVAMENV